MAPMARSVHPAHVVRKDEVTDVDSLEFYICQQLGVGYVTVQDRVMYRRKVKLFFEQYPQGTWASLIATVEWAKTRKKRFARLPNVIDSVRFALEDGFLPELDPNSEVSVDEQVRQVLITETDTNWRHRLLVAQGWLGKTQVLQAWESAHV